MRALTIVAVGLVFLGVIALVGPAFGFSTVATDRGVSVGTADQANAFLGIEATGEAPTQNSNAEIIEISNNAPKAFQLLETEVDIDGERIEVSEDFDDELGAGESTRLEVTCNRGGTGTASVTVTADVSESPISISGVTFTEEIPYSCTGRPGGGGFESVSAGNVEGGATTQEFSFVPDERIVQGETIVIRSDSVGPFGLSSLDYSDASVSIVESGNRNDVVEIVENDGGAITIEFTSQNSQRGEVTVLVENVATDETFLGFGLGTAEFTREGGTMSDDFLVVESAGSGAGTQTQAMGAESTSQSSHDEPLTITESELEEADIDELEGVDDHNELRDVIDDHDELELVDDSQ